MSRFGGVTSGSSSILNDWTNRRSSSSNVIAPTSILGFDYSTAKGIWTLNSTTQFPKKPIITTMSVVSAQTGASATSPTAATYTIPVTAQVGDLLMLYSTSVNNAGGGLPTLVTNSADGFTAITSISAERARSNVSVKIIESSDIGKTLTGMVGTNAARYYAILYRGNIPVTGFSINNVYAQPRETSIALTSPVNISPVNTNKYTIALAALQAQNTSSLSISGVATTQLTVNAFNFVNYGTGNSSGQTMTYTVGTQSGTYRMAVIVFIDITNS